MLLMLLLVVLLMLRAIVILLLIVLLIMLLLIVLLLAALRERLRVTRYVRLRLVRLIARLVLPHVGLAVIVAIVVEIVAALLRIAASLLLLLLLLLIVIRVLLAKLFLRRRDQAEIMFGVLVIIFRRNRVAGALRVAGELNVFFRNVRRRSADLNVGAVRLVNPCQRILILAVVIAPPHAFLTVSHVSPVTGLSLFARPRAAEWFT